MIIDSCKYALQLNSDTMQQIGELLRPMIAELQRGDEKIQKMEKNQRTAELDKFVQQVADKGYINSFYMADGFSGDLKSCLQQHMNKEFMTGEKKDMYPVKISTVVEGKIGQPEFTICCFCVDHHKERGFQVTGIQLLKKTPHVRNFLKDVMTGLSTENMPTKKGLLNRLSQSLENTASPKVVTLDHLKQFANAIAKKGFTGPFQSVNGQHEDLYQLLIMEFDKMMAAQHNGKWFPFTVSTQTDGKGKKERNYCYFHIKPDLIDGLAVNSIKIQRINIQKNDILRESTIMKLSTATIPTPADINRQLKENLSQSKKSRKRIGL